MRKNQKVTIATDGTQGRVTAVKDCETSGDRIARVELQDGTEQWHVIDDLRKLPRTFASWAIQLLFVAFAVVIVAGVMAGISASF